MAAHIGMGNFSGAIASNIFRSQDAPRYIVARESRLLGEVRVLTVMGRRHRARLPRYGAHRGAGAGLTLHEYQRAPRPGAARARGQVALYGGRAEGTWRPRARFPLYDLIRVTVREISDLLVQGVSADCTPLLIAHLCSDVYDYPPLCNLQLTA